VLEVKNGQHPILLKEFMAKKVSLETICIMDEIVEFTKDWDRMISERIVYPEIHNKINKYKSFVDFDRVKYKKVLIDLCG
jgi:predicted nucleic acid-binding OB-fold protein